ncbi:hypothetical protein [Paenibacillus mucilaginosus]|uniref:Cytochrome-c oxidase n=1 Tax=Paenibacillus mucilaginosus (strain KNP414) TaxID=1036673 RepID=F8FAL1_PAEMK|nr:hypothetical protein [Paenibacillus mucilaginosus]AEI41100.1 conserved hypothetical protein [Paenibacillus mucilaginosus KNP414]MCG7211463.1 cbb3-type cytochrome c oxidase subunit I [Paenibacillus mucilaginosus]WDM30161.1 cytochrome-c oxidase [Paenibacillus mucilaginosus]
MGKTFIKIAAVYFGVGVSLGLMMGILHNFSLTSVHAHINLLGWVSMALFGLIYHVYPKAAQTRIAKLHFWLYNIAFPMMQVAIALQITIPTVPVFLPVTIVSSMAVVISVLLFGWNLFRQLTDTSAPRAR